MLFTLTNQEISIEKHMKAVQRDDCGGICSFVGTVRDSFQGRKVLELEYTVYERMAFKEMEKIFEEAKASFQRLKAVSVEHRIGIVKAGEASVIIACSSPDRASCMQATVFFIEEIKRRLPIWKKEIGEDWAEWKANVEWKSPVDC